MPALAEGWGYGRIDPDVQSSIRRSSAAQRGGIESAAASTRSRLVRGTQCSYQKRVLLAFMGKEKRPRRGALLNLYLLDRYGVTSSTRPEPAVSNLKVAPPLVFLVVAAH